jgi:hypothetical protein
LILIVGYYQVLTYKKTGVNMSLLQVALMSAGKSGANFIPPIPGSNNPPNTMNTSFSAQGTPYDPVSSQPSQSTSALFRRAYLGYWANPSSYNDNNPSIFNGAPFDIQTSDSYIAFGIQTTGDQYCMEWKGYFRPNATANWNFVCQADDVVMFWIGDAALNPNNSNWLCNNGQNNGLNYNSVSLTQNNWYPIRVRYQEWGGGESLNIFCAPAGSDMIALYQYGWANQCHNPNTQGY